MGKKNPDTHWLRVLATDTLGVLLLLLVPLIGPLPGPGGIPLLLAGFSLLAINHDWADGAMAYINKHSVSLRAVVFPNIRWVKWSWDIFAIALIVAGTYLNIVADNWLIKLVSLGVMGGSTTILILNRNRINALDKFLRRTGKK
jgi:hypothetical protein